MADGATFRPERDKTGTRGPLHRRSAVSRSCGRARTEEDEPTTNQTGRKTGTSTPLEPKLTTGPTTKTKEFQKANLITCEHREVLLTTNLLCALRAH